MRWDWLESVSIRGLIHGSWALFSYMDERQWDFRSFLPADRDVFDLELKIIFFCLIMFYKPTGFHTRWCFNRITKIFIKDGVSIKMFLFYLFECGPCEASAREPTKRFLGDLRFSSLVAWTAGKATSSCNEIPMDGYNPRQTHLFLAIYRGYFTPLYSTYNW